MPFEAYIKSIQFKDRRLIDLEKNTILIMVGPNNSGKTTALNSIYFGARQHNQNINNFGGFFVSPNPLINSVELFANGNREEVDEFLQENAKLVGENYIYGAGAHMRNTIIRYSLEYRASNNFNPLGPIIASISTPVERVRYGDSIPSIDFGTTAYTHPLHHLHQTESLMEKLSSSFKKAFGTEIGIDVMAGVTIPLHVGNGAEIRAGETVNSRTYKDRLRSLPRLETQGDGIRSYVSTLLSSAILGQKMIFIDEPETFLHPPQIRQMARTLGSIASNDKQIFIATHSPDFVRGILESDHKNIVIVRLDRIGDTTSTSELRGPDLKSSWSDPALRYSNGLDGVFYDRTIVCEADGDCKFYGALSDSLREADCEAFVREALFVQAGGKGGMPKIVRALKSLAVPVVAVVDFDIFHQTGQFRSLLDALGASYEIFKDDLQIVRDAVEKIGTNKVKDAKQKVISLVETVPNESETFPAKITKQISQALKPSQGWELAKNSGISLFSGKDRLAADRLLSGLASSGLYVVPSGELESFIPHETDGKDRWVRKVLEDHGNSLLEEPALASARKFVRSFMTK